MLVGKVESVKVLKSGEAKATITFGNGNINEIIKYNNQVVKMVISVDNIDQQAIKVINKADVMPDGKTPSQKLRAVMYRIWESMGQEKQDFNDFYNVEMIKIIEHYKNKIQ